ncbi:MAG: TetR/AcrR family transcriptional regulator [Pseudomonadota bacterium]
MTKLQEPAALAGKRATLGRILAAAKEEFAANGLAGARVDAIAAAAGVTKQLVYHYYEGKEKLFEAVLAEASALVMSELVSLDVAQLAPPDALRTFLNHMFDQYAADPALRSLSQEGSRYHETHDIPGNKFPDMAPALVSVLETILERGAASGDFRPGVDARIFTAIASLVTSGGFTSRFMLSVLAGFDTASADGAAAWRRHSADFILASIAVQGCATK